MALDPEAFREKRNADARAWRAKNREAYNRRAREARRDNPEPKRAISRASNERHREKNLERRREKYRRNPEAYREQNRRYKEREKTRRALGLPPRRIHNVTATERSANRTAADEFFHRSRTSEEKTAIRAEDWTPQHLIAAWERETTRIRAIHGSAQDASLRERQQRDLTGRKARLAAEEARMDAIARGINDRLRTQPRTRQPPPAHLAPPHPPTYQQPRGL